MYSGNRSGSQGSWEGDGPAGAEGSAPEGTLSPTPLFSPGTYERLALLFGSVGLLGAGSNLLVLVLYYKFQRLRTPTHLFLVNISLGDLLMSLFGVTFTFVSCLRNRWVWDTVGCVWDGFSSSLFGIVSITTLTVLAYERYIRVVHARVINFSWAWRAITYIWLYSLAWAGAPLLGWNRYILDVHGLGCTVEWKSKDANDSSFVLFLFLGCLVVPVGVIAHCYGHILYSIRMLRCVEDLQTIQVIKILRYEKKLAKMCFVMVFTFLICWMPYIVVCFLVANGYGQRVTPTVSIVSNLFAKSSTVYNPVIYIFMIRKFRRSLLQLLCSRLLRCQQPAKDLPAVGNEMQIRPIVISQKDGERPKKKVTFNSSSIVFIITSDESLSVDDSNRTSGSKADVIQVRPL
ncbi:opsin-3 isoform X3 [Ictidomys tridecemlineatus]|uniref:Opsin-3 n=2 Tax=Marmotini TaxID=337730 RepID=I3MJN4_ICTTR|nr:opsin-3 isoform X2 [Ictidomys tridecemlineatus]XP_026246546.1 opsin-3 [Urocitellus parryii]KAG3257912.1 opsin 3, transcript variant X1 [Ictidomys tridecemlineatus]